MRLPIRLYVSLLFLSVLNTLNAQQIPIGQWRDELPYTLCNSVSEAPDRIYCSTPYAIFYISKEDNSVVRTTKINGLSDIGISCIKYNKDYNTLVIAYSNANIDLLKDNVIINISDIKRKTILGNKTIHSIYFIGKYAYLSCGFGIVVLDIDKEEIRDTYLIGQDGSQINVLGLVKDDQDSLFAASDHGLYKASFKNPNLVNFANWHKDLRIDTNAEYSSITYFSNKIVVNKRNRVVPDIIRDTLYTYGSGSWSKWPQSPFDPVMKIESNSKYLLVSYRYYIKVYDPSFKDLVQIGNYYPGTPFPLDAIADKDDIAWIGDTYSGLISFDLKQYLINHYNLSGPLTDKAFSMTCKGNDLYISPGGRDASYVPLYFQPQIYQFDNTNWKNYTGYTNPPLSVCHDVVIVAVDPYDSKRFFAGTWGKGLLEFYNGETVNRFVESNSTLRHHSASDTSDIRVGGVSFDRDGNLWVVTSHTNSCLSLKKGNNWYGFTIPIIQESNLGTLLVDRNNQVWVTMYYGNMNPYSLFVFTDNGTPDNQNDDQAKKLNSTPGNGNLPGTTVYCMAEDLNGEIWIGTEKGIGVFYSPENVFVPGQNFDAQRILVEQDGYVQYLLENEVATAIAIDGANRKWIGTDRGGVFLFSEDGTKQIYHFTESNSPLLSNRITSIAINNLSGEVFFGTDKGVISFKSTATEGGETNGNVYAYPNPVREGYEGVIAIKGLVTNAQVKITDINGQLVFATIAEGGQAIWDGKNFNGNRAKTGVYMVFASDSNGKEKVVTKILIIN